MLGAPFAHPEVTYAADGSWDHLEPDGAYGWVSDDGRFEFGVVSAPEKALTTELAAILHAVTKSKTQDNVLIITDCTGAIDTIAKIAAGRTTAPDVVLRTAQKIVAAVRHRNITIRWVRGHNGHPMNETADFLARNEMAARRDAAGAREYQKLRGKLEKAARTRTSQLLAA